MILKNPAPKGGMILKNSGQRGPYVLKTVNQDELHETHRDRYKTFERTAWPLLGPNRDKWDVLFSAQHHGLPTRLIDFTRSLPVAVYFALKDRKPGDRPTIIMVDPHELNRHSIGPFIVPIDNVALTHYHPISGPPPPISGSKEVFGPLFSVAIAPPFCTGRMTAQQSTFVMAGDFPAPLEGEEPEDVRIFHLDDNACVQAARFLKLTGVRESDLFPDLDAIARDVIREYAYEDVLNETAHHE